MPSTELDNLVRTGQLKQERPSQAEYDGLLKSGKARLADARKNTLALARAFAGELVPTEAELARTEGRSYETAEALLERIRRERDAAETTKNPRPRRKGGAKRAATSRARSR